MKARNVQNIKPRIHSRIADVLFFEALRFKKDAPSGTALAFGRSVVSVLRRELDAVTVSGRNGSVGVRGKKDIALLSVRAGDIVGGIGAASSSFTAPTAAKFRSRRASRRRLARGSFPPEVAPRFPRLFEMRS